jgi:hypothetical protein
MNPVTFDQLVYEVGVLYLRSLFAERERDALKKELAELKSAKPAPDAPNPNPNPTPALMSPA